MGALGRCGSKRHWPVSHGRHAGVPTRRGTRRPGRRDLSYIPANRRAGAEFSLRDVADLEDCLASVDLRNPRELAAALARYDRHRRADIGFRTLGVDILNRSLIIPHLPVDLLRGAGFLAMTALGPLRRAVIREGVSPHLLLPRLMQAKAPRRRSMGAN